MALNPTSLTVVTGNSGTIAVSTATTAGAPQQVALALVADVPPSPAATGASGFASAGTMPGLGAAQPAPVFVGGLPAGVSASFNPQVVTSGGSSVLTITVAPGTAVGSYNMKVLGHGVTVDHSDAFVLTVQAGTGNPDFSL